MSATPLEKALPYYEQVYHSIKQMILKGVFSPGERVYEAKIAREFGVSRSPVREAVRALITDGLLIIDDKSQITVYHPNMLDVEDIYQCRMVLESLAVKLTTNKATDEQLAQIRTNLVETEEMVESLKEPKDKERLIELNAQFHDLIPQYSQNKRLQKQIGDLRSLAYYFRIKNFNGENRARTIFEEHKQIFTYMEQRDETKAAMAMETHISNDLKHLKKIMQDDMEGQSHLQT